MNTKNSTRQQQNCHLVEFLEFNSAFGQTQALINTYFITIFQHHHYQKNASRKLPESFQKHLEVFQMSSSSMLVVMMVLEDSDEIGINQCLCLLKAGLNTKNSTKRRRTRFFPSDGTPFKWQIELNTKNSTKQQQCRLVEFLVFNPAFGRDSN